MFSKLSALTILIACFLVGQSIQEECAPQSVVNLEVNASHVLRWTLRLIEPCDIDEFLVYIFHPDQPAEYAFTVNEHYVDVSFLEVCEEWIFAVVPISGHTVGAERRVVAKLPLPTDANLSLDHLDVNHNSDNGYTTLFWGLADPSLGNCSLKYRVTIEEAGEPVIEDFYVEGKNYIALHFLSSCMTYQIGVRAINIAADPTIEGPLKTDVVALPGKRLSAPFLLEADSTTSTISLSLRLDSEIRNPCHLRALYLEGEAAISRIIDLDSQERRINVTVENLVPDTVYNINIYVANSVGWSDPTILSIATKAVDADLPLIEKKEE